MSHILSLLRAMRRYPGMYIGKPSLIRLGAYLDGFAHAAQELGGKEPDWFIRDFCDWIHGRAGSTQYSWEETIIQECKDDADAQERFWELLDEFLALRGMDAITDTRADAGAFPPVPALTPGTVTKSA